MATRRTSAERIAIIRQRWEEQDNWDMLPNTTPAPTYADTVTLDAYAWPGCYPILYHDNEGNELCADCAASLDYSTVVCDYDVMDGDPIIDYGRDGAIRCDNCGTVIVETDN